jgi:hypothetical protein
MYEESVLKLSGRVVVLGLGVALIAACSSGSSGGTTSKSQTTVQPSVQVAALAARLQCRGGAPRPTGIGGTGLAPVALYTCALPRGLGTSLVAYTPAQMKKLRQPSTVQLLCRAIDQQSGVPSVYAVFGPDYVASVQYGGDGGDPKTYKSRSEALARSLKSTLTTFDCTRT